jgi:hypothetical protein
MWCIETITMATMKMIFLLLLFASVRSFSQDQLDFGKVRADENFTCSDRPFIDSSYRIDKICDSKNVFEVRLGIMYAPLPGFELIVLAYDGSNWTAIKYEDRFNDSAYNTPRGSGRVKVTQLKPKKDFRRVFKALKRNNIFTLPDQNEIKVKRFVFDGVGYSLTFKAGNKFRTYTFDNTEEYRKRYKHIKEFRNYDCIVNTFWNWLKEK